MANRASTGVQFDGTVPDWKWVAGEGQRKGKPDMGTGPARLLVGTT